MVGIMPVFNPDNGDRIRPPTGDQYGDGTLPPVITRRWRRKQRTPGLIGSLQTDAPSQPASSGSGSRGVVAQAASNATLATKVQKTIVLALRDDPGERKNQLA